MTYLVFLAILSTIAFGMHTESTYFITKAITNTFIDRQIPLNKKTFRTMNTLDDFWQYMNHTFVLGLHWDEYYNRQEVPEDDLGYIFYSNQVLGLARLRQLRMANDSCTIHNSFNHLITTCFDTYVSSKQDTSWYGPMEGLEGTIDKKKLANNETAWIYQTSTELDGSGHWGHLAYYGGDGYIQLLGKRGNESRAIINGLRENLWIRRGTRVVFVDFTVYNANVNLFCVVRLIIEFPATGKVMTSWEFRTVKLLRYVNMLDHVILGFECVFIVFTLYYTVEETLEIKVNGKKYFKHFWNWIDLLLLVGSYCCIAFDIYLTVNVHIKLHDLLHGRDEKFVDFDFLSFAQMLLGYGIGATVFFAWVKTFKYVSFNKTMTQLSETLKRCAKDIGGFSVMFFIIFFGFAQLGYLVFGSVMKDFSKFGEAGFTCMRFVLGNLDFVELEEANRVLGPIYFMAYLFLVLFVLLNMFLAIINDAYSEVKAKLANKKNKFNISDYFKKSFWRVQRKLQKKRNKIVDLQKAVEEVTKSEKTQVNFEDLRQALKSRGYGEMEIESIFIQYDLNGDRILSSEELSAVLEGLEEEKAEVDRRMLDDGKDNEKKGTDKAKDPSEKDKKEDAKQEHTSTEGNTSSMGPTGTTAGSNSKSKTVEEEAEATGKLNYGVFDAMCERVGGLEASMGQIIKRIDNVMENLDALEKSRMRKQAKMGKIISNINESAGKTEREKRHEMERLVRDEIDNWDRTTPSDARIRSAAAEKSERRRRRSRRRAKSDDDSD